MIIKRNTLEQDFTQDGFLHSRRKDPELTKLCKDLNVSCSRYSCNTIYGKVDYIDVWLNEDSSKFFWLGNFDSLGDENPLGIHGWGIHFRTYEDNNRRDKFTGCVISESQKQRLFEATSRVIPKGDLLSTYGTISPGGVHALSRFKTLGFKQVGTAYPKDVTDKEKTIAVPIWKKL